MGKRRAKGRKKNSNLACLEELVTEIDQSSKDSGDPWKDFPALRLLLKDRVDFDTVFPTIEVIKEYCKTNEKSPCSNQTATAFGPRDVMSGTLFEAMKSVWREEGDPLGVKLDQLRESWWDSVVPNMLETTPDRPHIKHVIMVSLEIRITFNFLVQLNR